jgi:hypothetical protein
MTLTSYHTLPDDIRNAGGHWVDREVVEDANWVSSRQPEDIPAFNRALLRLFAGSLASTPLPSHGSVPQRRRQKGPGVDLINSRSLLSNTFVSGGMNRSVTANPFKSPRSSAGPA